VASVIRIALIGDRNDAIIAHRAIPIALELVKRDLNTEVQGDWIHSSEISAASRQLDRYHGIWCVPGSPYANTEGVLSSIAFARQSGRPFLGTCGGFQHAMLEYARGVWGIAAAAHAETDPAAVDPVIAPLACSLVNVAATLHFAAGSRLARIYGTLGPVSEEYHCSYGLNPSFAARLNDGPLRVSARDGEGSVRGVELDGHPFYVGTLFQPERAALRGQTPSLVRAFVAAAVAEALTPTLSLEGRGG